MNYAVKIFVFLIIFVSQIGVIYAQNVSRDETKPVKWEAIGGKDNEFMIFMPENYLLAADGDYYMGKPPATRVKKRLTIGRYINRVVLITDYYEGNVKQIQKELQEREKLTPEKQLEINGFQIQHLTGNSDNRVQKVQFFSTKDRLYTAKTIAETEDDKIVKAFFESIRLINENTTTAPNAPQGATQTMLPKLFEQQTGSYDDTNAVSSEDVDRKLIILKTDRPRYTLEMRRGGGPFQIKMKVLFSASGKVADVEILNSPSKVLGKVAVEAVKNTVFIPAEKDGKLVSVYKTIEHSFETGRY